ncbi:MAG: hypothetical protein OH319_04370 [Candidatus Parvarchaeota archaeon]|nr:hypothetical protein [Candidatus Jingweiarchaeum tengchongense]MCW1297929.1 hypothetical protein [Candidatus Jingweiarchaeum tengchongense]MCW1300648.1 hypothetical protein [Candidatus Jingweiarchaeum tengchongense]MCW1304633.1 hypothetical protein [Candidatus Jingweiarchaeum tengchongense]MCW1305650.1 hypothetical protein [Candidatus Jingweiarchaeum tengchongense]
MECSVIIMPFGAFAFDKNGKVVWRKTFGKNAEQCAKLFLDTEKLKEEIKKEASLNNIDITNFKEEAIDLEKFAIEQGVFKKPEEFSSFMSDFSIKLTQLKMKQAFSADILIIHSILALEDLDKIINLIYERLSELFGLYFPEAMEKITSVDKLSSILSDKIERSEIAEELKISEESMGYEMKKDDLETIQEIAKKLDGILSLREKISKYIERKMEEIAPNLSKVAGPLLGAKLISLANGLENLARMPSSTIQVLGAEKALFRHLRTGTKPPKHGVILQHPLVRNAKISRRGRVARALAAKIAIASKVDFYSKGKEIVWEKLLKDLEEKMKDES